MSLINKMLQELDRRHALQPAASRSVGNVPAGVQPGSLPDRSLQPVHAATHMIGSEWFWRAVALLILITIGWIAWVAWQVTPRGTVTELALQSAKRPRAPAVAAPAAAESAATAAATASASAPMATPGSSAPAAAPIASAAVPVAPSTGAVAAAPALQAFAAKPDAERPDTLKLALEILTPFKQNGAPPAARAQAGASAAQKARAVPAAGAQAHVGPGAASATEAKGAGVKAASPEPIAKPAPKLATTQALSRAGVPASGQINKRDSGTPRDSAAAEYRRAVSFVNQGRIAEGMEALRAALAFDPSYEAARQTQITLLVEAKRMEEAATVLREGIALNPANAAFVMLAARIMVERNDTAGALELLREHAPAAAANADYRAFVAALYQRLGRHDDAVSEYRAALRIAPASGVWWVGLGISQEAQQRRAEAADSFRRAKETGTLSSELAGYVERRLKTPR